LRNFFIMKSLAEASWGLPMRDLVSSSLDRVGRGFGRRYMRGGITEQGGERERERERLGRNVARREFVRGMKEVGEVGITSMVYHIEMRTTWKQKPRRKHIETRRFRLGRARTPCEAELAMRG
jgi:hypothetical protein